MPTCPSLTLRSGKVYPAIGLKEARAARDAAKRLLADGRDPSEVKRADQAAKAAADTNTSDTIAGELLEKKRREGKAARTIVKFEWLMSFARPAIGSKPFGEITAPDRLIEARGATSRNTSPGIGSASLRVRRAGRHWPAGFRESLTGRAGLAANATGRRG